MGSVPTLAITIVTAVLATAVLIQLVWCKPYTFPNFFLSTAVTETAVVIAIAEWAYYPVSLNIVSTATAIALWEQTLTLGCIKSGIRYLI